jgi:hypothetical protein
MPSLSFIKLSLCYLALVVCIACEQTIVLPDPVDPRLPMYTEKGYNRGGAFINDVIWISDRSRTIFLNDSSPLLLIYPDLDSASLTFYGYLPGAGYGASIQFYLNDFEVNDASEITKLEGRTFMIDGVTNKGMVDVYAGKSRLCSVTGQLLIKYAQPTSGGKIILSGTFGMKTDDGCADPREVTYGRFDFYVSPIIKN